MSLVLGEWEKEAADGGFPSQRTREKESQSTLTIGCVGSRQRHVSLYKRTKSRWEQEGRMKMSKGLECSRKSAETKRLAGIPTSSMGFSFRSGPSVRWPAVVHFYLDIVNTPSDETSHSPLGLVFFQFSWISRQQVHGMRQVSRICYPSGFIWWPSSFRASSDQHDRQIRPNLLSTFVKIT